MAEVRTLVCKPMLEEILSGEVPEIWIIDPALADPFVREAKDLLEQ